MPVQACPGGPVNQLIVGHGAEFPYSRTKVLRQKRQEWSLSPSFQEEKSHRTWDPAPRPFARGYGRGSPSEAVRKNFFECDANHRGRPHTAPNLSFVAHLRHGLQKSAGGQITRFGPGQRVKGRPPAPRFLCDRHGRGAMGAAVCGLVASLIDWIEGPRSDQGRPRCPTEAVVETLRFFLREGVQWRELQATGDRVCGATLRRRLTEWSAAALLRRVHT